MTRVLPLLLALFVLLISSNTWATSPAVQTQVTTVDTDGTSTVVTQPASATTGDLVMVFCTHKASTLHTITSGTNWTIRDQGPFNTSSNSYSTFIKVLDGTGDNLTIAASAGNTVCDAVRISGQAVGLTIATHIERGSSSGTSSTPDPPVTSITLGSQDYLLLAVVWSNGIITYTPFSTGYTEVGQAKGAGAAVSVAVERKALTGTSDNPDTITADSSHAWLSRTYSIPSTLAASTVSGSGLLMGVD